MADKIKQRGTILPIAEYESGDVGLAVPGLIHEPIAAFGRLWSRGGYHPGTKDWEGVRDTFEVAGAVTGMGYARAAGGGVGLAASGGDIMKRADALKMVRDLTAKGKSSTEIAASLNERFAPMLDEGAEVTRGMVGGRQHRDKELGSAGGMPGRKLITAEDVAAMAAELELPASVRTAKSGTAYVDVGEADKRLTVRVPDAADPHGGSLRPWEVDTSIEGTRHVRLGQTNIAGEPYDRNPDALRDRLTYVFGKETKTARQALDDMPETRPVEGPIHDPRQLKLLSSGVPIPPLPEEPNRDPALGWLAGTHLGAP